MTTPTILDSNLLLLYVVGLHSTDAIARVKRLKAYSVADFDHLVALLKNSRGLILTPNTVTETSNLLHTGMRTREIEGATRQLAVLLTTFNEHYVASSQALVLPEVAALGVTDSILLILAKTGAVLLTADLALWEAARKAGFRTINFNHSRTPWRSKDQRA